MNKKVIFVLSAIMLLVAATGCGKTSNENKENKESNVTRNETSNKVEEKDESLFVIKHKASNESLAIADSKYFEEGTKKVITDSKNIYVVKTFDNKVYYIDDSNSLKAYDTKTEETKTYALSKAKANYNTDILPGKKYTVVTDGENFEIVNLENSTTNTVSLKNNRGTGVFDEENNTIYYSNNSVIYSYNIDTKADTKISGAEGYPMYIDGNSVYVDGEVGTSDTFYAIDRKTKKVNKLNIKDYAPNVSSIPNFNIVDGVVYLTYNTNEKLVRYENNAETNILEKEYLEYYIVGNNIYIAAAPLTSDGMGHEPFNEFYEYNINTKEMKETSNMYAKKLFTENDGVYNIK